MLFFERARGFAAVSMFAFLFFAIVVNAIQHRGERDLSLTVTYAVIAALMFFGAICIWRFHLGGGHQVGVLEAYEIVLFASFWSIQTVENWDEKVRVKPTSEDVELVDRR